MYALGSSKLMETGHNVRCSPRPDLINCVQQQDTRVSYRGILISRDVSNRADKLCPVS